MILSITANPALDITYRVDVLNPGATHRTETALARAGGKGVNVARVAHAQGFTALAIVTAGGPTGALLTAELDASGVPYLAVPVAAESRRSIAIVGDAGDATVLNEYGEPLSGSETEAFLAAVREASGRASAVAISGSMPAGGGSALLERIISTVRAATSAPLIVDTSGSALLTAARAGATVLKPNHVELADATGESDPVAGAEKLLELGAQLVVVSLGDKGMLAVSAGPRVVRAYLPRVLSGNPTGAGDAAVAAIATVLAEAGDTETALTRAIHTPEPMLRRAVSWSAAAVLMPTAGEISDEHHALADDVVITKETQ